MKTENKTKAQKTQIPTISYLILTLIFAYLVGVMDLTRNMVVYIGKMQKDMQFDDVTGKMKRV